MKQRDRIRMSEDEIRAFLAQGRTAAVATIGASGFPHVVAMWYVPTEDGIAFWTYAKSQKLVNLRRDPRLSVLVETGDDYSELRGVEIEGTAEIITDTPAVHAFGERLLTRYGNGTLDDAQRQFVASQAPKRNLVIVHPVRVASWDHRKLGGSY